MKKARLILVFLLSLFLVKSVFSQNYPYTNYSIITIQNNVNSNLYNYPILITLNNTQALITNGYLNPTCTNLIFQQNGQGLPYFVQTCGYISVSSSIGFGNTNIPLSNNPSIPVSLSPVNGSWWGNNIWTGSSQDTYASISLNLNGYAYPVWLEVNTSGAEYAIWVNGQYIYNSNPWNFSYNSQQPANTTDQVFDLTNYIVQNSTNNILIFATSNTTNNYLSYQIIIPSANVTISSNGIYYLPGTIWLNVPSIPANNYTNIYLLLTYPNTSTIINNLSNVFTYGTHKISNTYNNLYVIKDTVFSDIPGSEYGYEQWLLTPFLYQVNDYCSNSNYYLVPYEITGISIPVNKGKYTLTGVNVGYYLSSYLSSTSIGPGQFVTVQQNYTTQVNTWSSININLPTPIFWLDGYYLNLIFNRPPIGGAGEIFGISGMNATGLYGVIDNGYYPLYNIPVESYNIIPLSYITGYFRPFVSPEPTVSMSILLNISNTTNISAPISINIQFPQPNSTVAILPNNQVLQPIVVINSTLPINSCNMTLYNSVSTIYSGTCTPAINVTGIQPGFYTLFVSASNQYNSTNTSVTFYMTIANGVYNFTYMTYPSSVPSTPFYINISTTCTNNICAPGQVSLITPVACYTPTPTINIPEMLPGQIFNTSFIVQCAYATYPYVFNVSFYLAGSLFSTQGISLNGPSLSLSYNITNGIFYVYAYPSEWGQNITLLTTVQQGWVMNSTTTQNQFYINISDNTPSIIYSSPAIPGQIYTVYAQVYSPYFFDTYPTQSIFTTIQATQPPTIYSVNIPSTNYNGLLTNICYNVSDQIAVTNVSGYYINNLGQTIYLFNNTYFNQSVYACTPVNLTLGNYSIYVKACDYSGLCSIFPPVPVSIIPYPPYNIIIYPSNVSIFHSSPQVISIYYSHPLEPYTSCIITSSSGTINMRVTLYNNTNNTIAFSFQPGQYNLFITCSSNYTAETVPFTIIYNYLPPMINSVNISNGYLILNVSSNVGLLNVAYNITVGNTTNSYNQTLSGTSAIIQIPLPTGPFTIIGYIYDISGLSMPFIYGISGTSVIITNSTVGNTTSGSTSYIPLLLPSINVSETPKGLMVTAMAVSRYYPVNCTIEPFNTSVTLGSSLPYAAIIPNASVGTYPVYAVCTDPAGDIATSNSIPVSVSPDYLQFVGTANTIATENTLYSLPLLGIIFAILGYLFRSKTLFFSGTELALSTPIIYAILSTLSPVFIGLSVVPVILGAYILYKYILPLW